MVTSHVSCPALNRTRNSMEDRHSIISIDNEHRIPCEVRNSNNGCELCSQCSNDSENHSSSIVDERCSCSLVHDDHSSIHTGSSSSVHHHPHYHHHSSGNSSWKEDLKSADAFSICSSIPNHNTTGNKEYNNKRYSSNNSHNHKLDFIHNNAIPDDIVTITKSITSSKNNHRNKTKRKRCCFCCCFRSNTTSKWTVFFIFSICVLGAIAIFFCWPRTPRVSMGGGADSVNGLPPDWWAGERSPIPSVEDNANVDIPSRPSLRGTWQINVTLDNRDNWIPTHIRGLEFVMMDSLTLAKFAWASTSNMVLQPGTISPISLTFNVNYQAPNNMDPTFQNLFNACGPLKKSNDGQRPALNVLLKVYFHIFGIIWTPIVTATPYTGGILCPIK